jgi:hypothetical protein
MPPPVENDSVARHVRINNLLLWILPTAMLLTGTLNIPLSLTNSVGEPFRAWSYAGSSFGCLLAIAMLVGDFYLWRSHSPTYKLKVLRQCAIGGLILISWQLIVNVRAGVLVSGSGSVKSSVEFSLLTLTSILGFTWWNLILRIRQEHRRSGALNS